MGHPLFIYAALRTWFSKYDRTHPHFAVDLPDEGTSVPDGYFTVVLNTSPYTYLGNRALDLSPYANLERGLVAITFRSLRARPFLMALARTLQGRPIESNRTVDEHHDLARLDVESTRPFPYQVDGEYLGETRRLRFQYRPEVMDLLFPQRADGSAG
jgi:diacylglycerol kinase family enzyme